jgi:hypothetical protein
MYSIQYLTVLTFFGCEHVKTFDYKVYYVCLQTGYPAYKVKTRGRCAPM